MISWFILTLSCIMSQNGQTNFFFFSTFAAFNPLNKCQPHEMVKHTMCLIILWGSRLKTGFCRIYNLYVCIQRVYKIQSIIHKWIKKMTLLGSWFWRHHPNAKHHLHLTPSAPNISLLKFVSNCCSRKFPIRTSDCPWWTQ